MYDLVEHTAQPHLCYPHQFSCVASLAAGVEQSLLHQAEAHLHIKVTEWHKVSIKIGKNGKEIPAEVSVCTDA